MGQNDHLAHSKGPWKKHLYTGTIVTANGKKRYVYPGKGNGERVGATRIKASGERTHYTKNYQIDDNGKASKRPGTSAYAVKTKAKRKLQTTARDVKYYGGKAAAKAGKAVSEATGKAKTKAYGTKYAAKAYGTKAKLTAKDVSRAASKAARNAKYTASSKISVAKFRTSQKAKKARKSVAAATSYGKSAINNLFKKARSSYRVARGKYNVAKETRKINRNRAKSKKA